MSNSISLDIQGRTLTIDIGKVARQADGSALVRYGDTVMLVTATSKKDMKETKPFLPLIIDYRENTYAAGKIPGGFFKREGRMTEREILIARMIDRPVRSLFPEGYFFDTQVVGLLLSADLENDPDTLGIIGASAALYFSDIPFTTPIGAVKIGLVDGRFVVNPKTSELEGSLLNMVVVGTEHGIVMIEAAAVEVDENTVIEAIDLAMEQIKRIVQAQKDAYARSGIQKREFIPVETDDDLLARLKEEIGDALLKALQIPNKKAGEQAVVKIRQFLVDRVPEGDEKEIAHVQRHFYILQERLAREFILNNRARTDGRRFDEIRPIKIEVGFLPRTHGSALFTRGETQCQATVTLGTVSDIQRLDGIGAESEKRFMLHYNFMPFCVGEVGFLRGPGRREIGHGALAEKGLLPGIPDSEAFPYTVRIVADILESNGSSSMATACAGALALMDAGVPLTRVVSGIAMGLVKDGDRYAVLTDIAGVEDHFGDMDFKVIGSEKGITAIQMDLKISHVTRQILSEALEQARNARIEILNKMKAAIAQPRPEISIYAPRILTLFINPEKVGDVIGPAGKVIKRITAATGVKIDVEENGKIIIASTDVEAAERAKEMIHEITIEAEVGKTYTGKVVRLEDYGAFVEILPNIYGLLHISEVANYRINSIRDHIKMGQMLTVKVISIDDDNKVRVSKKALEESESSDGESAPSSGNTYSGQQRDSNRPPRRHNRNRF
jgi:polyribonucleotide nucleotidyltransferase